MLLSNMQPVTAVQAFPNLFQPYHAPVEASPPDVQSYIELPILSHENYQTLAAHPSFSAIKAQFLADIDKLKQLAVRYVGTQYADDIDVFRNKIDQPESSSFSYLFPIFVNTRRHIHKIVSLLAQRQFVNNQADADPAKVGSGDITDDTIGSLLHECLNGITLCFDGIHSRFSHVFLTLGAIRGGLEGKIYQIRKQLFCEFVAAHLFKLQRTGIYEILENMEVHWVNALHNLHCEQLGLESIQDIFAPRHLPRSLITEFVNAAAYAVNPCTIIRRLAIDWQGQLSSALNFLGCGHWLTEKLSLDDIPPGHMNDLEAQFFNQINKLCHRMSDGKILTFQDIVDMDECCEFIQFCRSVEKLEAWAIKNILQVSGVVFATLSSFRGLYICTLGEIFFWVLRSTEKLELGDACQFNSADHISLELKHIQEINFSSWSALTSFALLTQAMHQTKDVTEIVEFFLSKSRELAALAVPVFNALVSRFSEKSLGCEPEKLTLLVDIICDHFMEEGIGLISASHVGWLLNTPLLESVLQGLQRKNIDISYIIPALKTWHIADFSIASLLSFFSPRNLRALLQQALELGQTAILEKLLRTECLDEEINRSNSRGQTPLMLLIAKENTSGVRYLLGKPGLNLAQTDYIGLAAIHYAAKHGGSGCMALLLAVQGININQGDSNSCTVLHWAAYKENAECLKLLLTASQININAKDNVGWTVLHRVAKNGNQECLQLLLGSAGIDINARDASNRIPLHIAAKYGRDNVVRCLLSLPNIDINTADQYGETALHKATANGHPECVKTLLGSPLININTKAQFNKTPLHYAAHEGKFDCLVLLLSKSNIQVNARDRYRETPLLNAIRYGRIDCAKCLIADMRTDINCVSVTPDTALSKAKRKGMSDIVALLEQDPRLNKHIDRTMRLLRR